MHSRPIQGRPAMKAMRSLALMAVAVAAGTSARAGDAAMRVATMPYDDCLAIIAEAARDLDEQPVTLADTGDLVLVRLAAGDGFVTISCRRSSNRMVLSKAIVPADAKTISETSR
jgi:hypothetical protein